jgi:hypothetical protein
MSDVATDETLETNILPDLPMEEEETPPPAGAPAEQTPPPPATDELRSAMAELAGTVKRIATPKEETPAPTPEQVAEFWQVYNPESSDKEFFRKFFRLNPDATEEEAQQFRELFGGMQKGLMKQAITAARNYIRMERSAIDEEYGPLKEFVETQKREATRGRFFSSYPGLDDKRFNKIIDATARSLDNKVFENEEAYFKALAEGAAGSLKEILPGFDLGAKQPKKPGQTPKLPRTSAGGGGGAGKGGSHDELQPTGKRNDIDSLEDGSE